MDFALISNGIVENVIVADDDEWVAGYVSDSSNPYELHVMIDDLNPKPGIGWGYKDNIFTQPNTEEVERLGV